MKLKSYFKKFSTLSFHFLAYRGFTVAELLVAISVIAFLSIAGVASYINYSQSQQVRIAAQELATTLKLAKSRAITHIKPESGSCGTNQNNPLPLDGYRVDISIDNGRYSLYAVCGGDNVLISKTSLPANIIFTTDTTVNNIFFRVLNVNIDEGYYGAIVVSGFNKKVEITIDKVGVIKTGELDDI